MEAITLQFEPTVSDYTRGARAFYMRNRSLWLGAGIFGVLFVVALLAGPFVELDLSLLLITLAVIVAMYLAMYLLLIPLLMALQVRRNERMRTPTTWKVGEERITVSNIYAESTFDWGTFHRVIDTPDFYLFPFTANKNMFQILPKRALATPEQASAFRQLLRRKLPGLPAIPTKQGDG